MSEFLSFVFVINPSKLAKDSKLIRQAVGQRMQQPDFLDICKRRLGFRPSLFEIEELTRVQNSVGDHWVKFIFPQSLFFWLICTGVFDFLVLCLQFLGAAVTMEVDLMVYWKYVNEGAWFRYPCSEEPAGSRGCIFIQAGCRRIGEPYHAEPLMDIPVKR